MKNLSRCQFPRSSLARVATAAASMSIISVTASSRIHLHSISSLSLIRARSVNPRFLSSATASVYLPSRGHKQSRAWPFSSR